MSTKLAVVTGSNRGIGLAIVRGLAKEFDGEVLLTARDEAKGKEALEQLEKEGMKGVKFYQLDISNEDSIKRLAMFIKNKYGGLDILVNNAGISFNRNSTEPFAVQAEETVKINYYSTKKVCQHLFPLLRSSARVVNLSSLTGWLKQMLDDDVKVKNTLSRDDLTLWELDQVMKDFVASAKEGKHRDDGWPDNAYIASKVAVSALSMVQQRIFDQDKENDIVINHVHPGLIQSDMTSGKGNRTPDEGAESTIFAAMLPPKTDIRGQFIWEDCTVFPWKGNREHKNITEFMAYFYPEVALS